MGGWAFLGGFLAVAIAIAIIVSVIRRKIRRFSRQVFGNADISKVLSEIETEEESTPRSLNGCDSLVIPQILKDFPDFDVNLMKTYARKYLKEKLGMFLLNHGKNNCITGGVNYPVFIYGLNI